ncbi:MAG: sigma-70 family RNA polymerase sigma factor [Planctomycetota bacterium]
MDEPSADLVEHFFRHESANLVSVLTRVFGLSQLPLVEDVVQSTLVVALEQWKIGGVPDKPAAWVHRVAKNKILDVLRRKNVESGVLQKIGDSYPQSVASGFEELFSEHTVEDSLLRMMFVCCHPVLDRASQVALTLKILCGFSIKEIAAGLLIGEESAKKRVQRARTKLAEENIDFVVPKHEELRERLGAVREVLYLMFNEGYSTTTGDEAIREDICEEAARLCHLLCHNETTSDGATRALLALMLFHASRFQSRFVNGRLMLLEEQDRGCWNQFLIEQGDQWLLRSGQDGLSTFHLEAGISQIHCHARSFEETDWKRVVALYDRLIELQPSSIYHLNRAVALSQSGETGLAIEQLLVLQDDPKMANYGLLDCALAHCFAELGDIRQSKSYLQLALSKVTSNHEKQFISNKLADLDTSDW